MGHNYNFSGDNIFQLVSGGKVTFDRNGPGKNGVSDRLLLFYFFNYMHSSFMHFHGLRNGR